MKCKHFKTRTKIINKKKTVYNYCTLFRKTVPFSCYQECDKKEYKQYKRLQSKKEYKIKSKSSKLAKLERNRFSIIYPDLTKCCKCGLKTGDFDKRINQYTYIAKNEVFEGSYRQISIRLGMIAPFCIFCHKKFHKDIMFNLSYKVMFEKEYLKTHTKEEFIKIFGQDYIFKLEQKKDNFLIT